MNRRDLFLGTATVAIAASIPAIALPMVEPEYHSVSFSDVFTVLSLKRELETGYRLYVPCHQSIMFENISRRAANFHVQGDVGRRITLEMSTRDALNIMLRNEMLKARESGKLFELRTDIGGYMEDFFIQLYGIHADRVVIERDGKIIRVVKDRHNNI